MEKIKKIFLRKYIDKKYKNYIKYIIRKGGRNL